MKITEDGRRIYDLSNDEDIIALTSPLSAVRNFREAALIAIVHADAALNERRGKGRTIFWDRVTAGFDYNSSHSLLADSTNLFIKYCNHLDVDPKQLLMQRGTEEHNANAFLEYGCFALSRQEAINEEIE